MHELVFAPDALDDGPIYPLELPVPFRHVILEHSFEFLPVAQHQQALPALVVVVECSLVKQPALIQAVQIFVV